MGAQASIQQRTAPQNTSHVLDVATEGHESNESDEGNDVDEGSGSQSNDGVCCIPYSVRDYRCEGEGRERSDGSLHEPCGEAGQEQRCLQVRWCLELEAEEDPCKASA